MRSNRLGCLSSTAVIASLITLVIIAGIAFASGGSMFSPGKLNAQPGKQMLAGVNSHADISDQCSLCHAAFWSTDSMSSRCVDCHTDVGAQLVDVGALHGAILETNPEAECRTCHPDHRGPDAPLTEMTNGRFPHDVLGFSLQGHAQLSDGSEFACSDCHGEDLSTFDDATCDSCHRQDDLVSTQAHVLWVGTDCLACHDGVDTYGAAFNHTMTAYTLVGKHQDALCSACHLDARSRADLQKTLQDCFSCHHLIEPHQLRFGQDCSECHTPNGWSPAKFDHNLSIFKLIGEHAKVDCEDCHTTGEYQGTPQDCVACHRSDDEHNGSFGEDCSLCHTPTGWEDITFDHNLSNFKLEASHATVACEQCHINKVFQGTPQDCYSCHKLDDEHNGRYGTDCGACHQPTNWKDASFNHNLSNFPLTGAHANVSCQRCHVNALYSNVSSTCVSCHRDPTYHAGMFSNNCESCHSTSNWSARYTGPHPRIDEENGMNHEGASCRDCHTTSLASATCTACHDSNNPSDDGDGGDDD